jgi:D-3-phosphoglycerate dehydrogenase / 2-oxoglutarate reductase
MKIALARPAPEPELSEALAKAGFEVIAPPAGWGERNAPPPSIEDLINHIGDADAALVSPRHRMAARVLENCPNLQTVISTVIGIDNIDLDFATEKGVLVCNSPAPENFIGVAEATVGLTVALVKNLKRNEAHLRSGQWYDVANRGVLARARTMGLIGVGRIGRETARRLSGWSLGLIGYDPYVEPAAVKDLGIELVGLEQLLHESDVVSIHALLTRETRDMIRLPQLRMMKPTAYLINTARGGIVNEPDLAQALNEGIIAGAALDVFAQEPLQADSPLRQVDPVKLIMTPHIIGHPQGVDIPSFVMAIDTVSKILGGEVPETIKNPEAVALWRGRFWS